jgi:hypothetical protein
VAVLTSAEEGIQWSIMPNVMTPLTLLGRIRDLSSRSQGPFFAKGHPPPTSTPACASHLPSPLSYELPLDWNPSLLSNRAHVSSPRCRHISERLGMSKRTKFSIRVFGVDAVTP